jgi:hypothetical protein
LLSFSPLLCMPWASMGSALTHSFSASVPSTRDFESLQVTAQYWTSVRFLSHLPHWEAVFWLFHFWVAKKLEISACF